MFSYTTNHNYLQQPLFLALRAPRFIENLGCVVSLQGNENVRKPGQECSSPPPVKGKIYHN